MRLLLNLSLLLIALSSWGQSLERHEKIHLFKTDQGNIYTERMVDSIRWTANHFVSKSLIRETPDSVYYSLRHFEKSLISDRYQKEGRYCDNRKKKDLTKIRKRFPYNTMHAIKVVSFKGELVDSLYVERKIPKTDGKVDLQKMFEVKTLDDDLTVKMLDILVNYDNAEHDMEVMMCYEPRNGIVFVDKADNVLGYIEICFDCQQYEVEPKNITLGFFCSEKLDAIQGIMMKAGITYGMARSLD